MGKLERVVRVQNNQYYVSGGYKLVKTQNPYHNVIKVSYDKTGLTTDKTKPFPLIQASYLQRSTLPRIHATQCQVVDTEPNTIQLKAYFVFQEPIQVCVGVFHNDVDVLSDKDTVKRFLKVHGHVQEVDAKLGYHYTSPVIDRAFVAIATDSDETEQGTQITEGDWYTVVVFGGSVSVEGSTPTDVYKILSFEKQDYSPPTLHRFSIDCVT